jgi:LacI family repressor for deo operon, udp, cdd, tsx, nupC, and nupG
MATIRDVSKEAGVSRATVTRTLQSPEKVAEKTRVKVEAAVKKLGYRPNMLSQTFRNKRTQTIVVLVPNIANPLFAKIVSGIEKTAQTRGYNLLLGDTHNSPKREENYIRMVETQLADGVLQLSSYSPGEPALPRAHVKAVSIAGVDATALPTIRIDNTAAAKKLTQYLVDAGHRRIGLLSGPSDNDNSKLRFKGHMQALAASGIEYDATLTCEGTFRMESGRQAARYFSEMKQGRPTAIFSMNDEMALGLIAGLRTSGLNVPGDMSICGFDGLDMGDYAEPRLTTMEQPAAEMGARGADLLIDMIEGDNETPQEIILPFKLIERESVAELK